MFPRGLRVFIRPHIARSVIFGQPYKFHNGPKNHYERWRILSLIYLACMSRGDVEGVRRASLRHNLPSAEMFWERACACACVCVHPAQAFAASR